MYKFHNQNENVIFPKLTDISYPEPSPNGFTPLYYAVLEKNSDKVKECIAAHPEWIETKDKYGLTPFLWAVKTDQQEICETLLKNGANVEATDNDGRTALMHATTLNYLPLVKMLLENDADPDAIDKNDVGTIQHAKNHKHHNVVKLLQTHSQSKKDYINAIYLKNIALIEELLTKGISLNAKPIYGKSALEWAIFNNDEKLTTLFLKNRNAKLIINATDSKNNTPLMQAILKGNLVIVKLLLENGAKLDIVNDNNETALNIAQKLNNTDIMALLIEYQDKKSSRKKPLQYASQKPIDNIEPDKSQTQEITKPPSGPLLK